MKGLDWQNPEAPQPDFTNPDWIGSRFETPLLTQFGMDEDLKTKLKIIIIKIIKAANNIIHMFMKGDKIEAPHPPFTNQVRKFGMDEDLEVYCMQQLSRLSVLPCIVFKLKKFLQQLVIQILKLNNFSLILISTPTSINLR
jgi:hypothetical protein